MGNFNRLPTDISLEIITRLPTESVLDCKLVCRPWRNLVSHHPLFSQLHLTRLNHSEDSSKLSFLILNENELYYFEYNEAPIDSIRGIYFTPPLERSGYKILGSFNGLVCLSGFQDNSVCVCNPVTKEFVKLPKLNRDWYSRGFGYLPFTNEYKVVEISKSRTDIEVSVYTIGSGNGWRNVGRFDFNSGLAYLGGGVFVNGALYWVNTIGGTVFVFDLTEEKFYLCISGPPRPPGMWCAYSIGVLGEVLYYDINYRCRITETSCSDIWLLKRKNHIHDKKVQVEQEKILVWSKGFSFSKEKPFSLTKSGSVLYFNYRSLGIYDAVTSTSKELVHFNGISQIFPHRNTLVSLRELGEENIEMMDSAEILED